MKWKVKTLCTVQFHNRCISICKCLKVNVQYGQSDENIPSLAKNYPKLHRWHESDQQKKLHI